MGDEWAAPPSSAPAGGAASSVRREAAGGGAEGLSREREQFCASADWGGFRKRTMKSVISGICSRNGEV